MTKEQGTPLAKISVRGLDAANMVLSDSVLARSCFVKALSERAEEVLQQGRVCRLRPEGVVFAAGQPAHSIFLVAAGELAVRGAGAAEDLVAGVVPAGEITGSEAALGESARLGTASATTEAVVVEIPVSAFSNMIAEGSPINVCLQSAMDRDMQAASDMADFLDRW